MMIARAGAMLFSAALVCSVRIPAVTTHTARIVRAREERRTGRRGWGGERLV